MSLVGKSTQYQTNRPGQGIATQKKHSRLPRKIHIATCCGQYQAHATISAPSVTRSDSAAATDTWLGSTAGNTLKE